VCETDNFSVDESWLSQQPRDRRPTGEIDLSAKVAAEKEIERLCEKAKDGSSTVGCSQAVE
jgi:hypothetical protein